MIFTHPLQWLWDNHLVHRYQEPHRFYHTEDHIDRMFGTYRSLYNGEPSIAEWLAIVYHDVIYEISPKNYSNEVASSSLLGAHYYGINDIGLARIFSEEDLMKAQRIILDTEHSANKVISFISHRVLDCDLEILAGSKNSYLHYSKNVRKEYSIYPDEVYYPGRIAVLESILARPKIYQTIQAYNLFENLARENIKKEIKQCQQLIDSFYQNNIRLA